MASARMEPATRAGSIRFGDARLHRHHSPPMPRPRRGGIWYRWTTTGLANPGDTKSLPQSFEAPVTEKIRNTPTTDINTSPMEPSV